MKFVIIICSNLIASMLMAQTVIPLNVGRSGHLFVKAKINGVEGNFIFDTAAGIHVISNTFFQKVKAQRKDSSYFTAFRHTGERLDGPIYSFDSISLGSLKQDNAWVGVYAGFDGQGFDGLISCKLIENQAVTVDIKNKQLIIETPVSLSAKNGDVVPILLHTDRNRSMDVFITVKIDHQHNAVMEFDTGAGYSPLLLHSRYMEYARLDTTRMEIRQSGTGFGKTEKTYFDKTKRLHIFIPEIKDGGYPNIVFKPSLIYDGLTSHVVFGDKAWTIDIPNQRILVYQ